MSGRLVHLSDLHLGFRAFPGIERGWNRRERDVASVFHRAIQEAARLEPNMVLITGDLFHRPDPPSTAFLTLTRGIRTLQALVPGVSVLVIAGERDTPRAPADPGPVAVLDTLPGIEAAAGAARAVRFRDTGIHALLVPHRAAQGPPRPELRPDRDARMNLLLLRGSPGDDADGLPLDPDEWDYVALGGGHAATIHHERVRTAGSLERIGWDPWAQATEEKGFMVFDLEKGQGEFHPIRTRPVVDLAPIRCDPADPEPGTRRLRHLLEGIPGGIRGKLVRVRLEGSLTRPEEGVEAGLLEALKRRAAHLEIRVSGPFSPPNGDQAREADPRLADGGPPGSPSGARNLDEEAPTHRPAPLPWKDDGARGPGGSSRGGDVPDLPSRLWREHQGVHLVTAEEISELERMGEEIAGAVGLEPTSPGRLLWEGGPVRELLAAWLEMQDGEASSSPDPSSADSRPAADSAEPATAVQSASREMEAALRAAREDWIEAEGEAEVRTLQWASDRQEAETRLQYYRDQARLLRRRLSALDGTDASCPTCAQPLNEVRDRLRSRLQEEWETLVQDGKWWKRRREQLEDRPDELKELEGRALRLRARVNDLAQQVQGRPASHRATVPPQPTGGPDPVDGEPAPDTTAPSPGGGPGLPPDDPRFRPLLRRAGNHLRRWSEGRLSGLTVEASGSLWVVDGMVPRASTPSEAAGVAMVLQLALWEEAWARRLPVPAGLLLRGLDERGSDPLMPLLERLPLDQMVVLATLPPRTPPSGDPRVRSLLARDPVVPGGLRPLATGPVALRLSESDAEGSASH